MPLLRRPPSALIRPTTNARFLALTRNQTRSITKVLLVTIPPNPWSVLLTRSPDGNSVFTQTLRYITPVNIPAFLFNKNKRFRWRYKLFIKFNQYFYFNHDSKEFPCTCKLHVAGCHFSIVSCPNKIVLPPPNSRTSFFIGSCEDFH